MLTSKNNLFNKKIPTFKPKTSLKHYAIGEKMYLYKKKNESQQHMNSLGMYFPIDLLKNNKYSKFINNVKSNNYVKYNGNNNMHIFYYLNNYTKYKTCFITYISYHIYLSYFQHLDNPDSALSYDPFTPIPQSITLKVILIIVGIKNIIKAAIALFIIFF